MLRLVKVANGLAIRQVKQGTETARLRIGAMCLALLYGELNKELKLLGSV